MEPLTTAAIIGGAATLGQSLIGGLFGGNSSNHYSRELMRYQAGLQHDENVYWANYNTPSQQMARLQEAGLNPNLVYGNGADAQASGSVSPSASRQLETPKIMDSLAIANLFEQNKNLREQNKKLRADTEYVEAQRDKTQTENSLADLEYNIRQSIGGAQYQGWLRNKQAIADYKGTLQKNELAEYNTLLAKTKLELDDLNLGISRDLERPIREAVLRTHVLENAFKEVDFQYLVPRLEAELNVSKAQAQNLLSNAALTAVLKALNSENIQGVKLDNIIKQREADLSKAGIYTRADWYVNLYNYIKKGLWDDLQAIPQAVGYSDAVKGTWLDW